MSLSALSIEVHRPSPVLPPRGRVLVVDDEPVMLRMVARALGSAGYEALRASDGEEALEVLACEHVDVVLSDVHMPRIGGLDLLRHTRGSDPDLPVVLMTGAPEGQCAAVAIEVGAVFYLPKPLDSRAITCVVDHAHRLGRLARIERQALSAVDPDARDAEGVRRLSAFFVQVRALAWEVYQRRARRDRPPPREDPVVSSGVGDTTRIWISPRTRDLLRASLVTTAAPHVPLYDRVTIGLTECSSIDDDPTVPVEVGTLWQQGFRVGFDEPERGRPAELLFGRIDPAVVSLEAALHRAIRHGTPQHQVVASTIGWCHDAGLLVAAAQAKRWEDREMLRELGCDLLPARAADWLGSDRPSG